MNASDESWTLVYESYHSDQEPLREALCTLGNGRFATRGAVTFADDGNHYPGTYLAGGYNRLRTDIQGHTVENEDLVNLPNWLPLTFRTPESDWFNIDNAQLLGFRQELDLKHGLLTRDIRTRDSLGRVTRIEERRLVSMADPHLCALELRLTPENWSGLITVRASLDGNVTTCSSPSVRCVE